MKIALLNGSPKPGKSNSGIMLKRFENYLTGHDLTHYSLCKKLPTETEYAQLFSANVWVFAFPLYIDAIPSHLFRVMVDIEARITSEQAKNIRIYAIINNGFYEGSQNRVAVEILQNWSERVGLCFGMAIGQGAGEMMPFVENVPTGYGPLKALGNAMQQLAEHIIKQEQTDALLFSPNLPWLAWNFTAVHGFWHVLAKKNGLKRKELFGKP